MGKRKGFGKECISVFALLAAASACAVGATEPSAGPTAAACVGAARPACIAMVDGFLIGYGTGIQRGIRSTFSHDPLVLQTTDGNEGTYERYRRVAARTACLPASLDGRSALAAFLTYLEANPDVAPEPFGDVMEVALDSAYPCGP